MSSGGDSDYDDARSSHIKSQKSILEEEKYTMQQAIAEDEIIRLTLDEGLSEIQRCVILLKKPEHDQQSYVFRNCRSIFKGNIKAQRELIPKILVSCHSFFNLCSMFSDLPGYDKQN